MKRTLFPIVTLAISLALTGCGGQGYSDSDVQLAREVCQEAVADKAKYPGGVEFIDSDETLEVTEYGGVRYEVEGEVDFVNGFNAPVRHKYSCYVGASDGDTGKPQVKVRER